MLMRSFVVVALLSVVSLNAQAPAPTLTEVQKLTLQNLSQRLEIAQLKAQAAQKDFDEARGEITRLIKTLEVPGYTFDYQTLSYVKQPELPK